MRAARAKNAARGRVQRAGRIALQMDLRRGLRRVRDRGGGQQGLCVRVSRRVKQGRGGGDFHHPPQVQDHHPVTQVLHHVQVMRNEQQGQPQLLAQADQQVDDLRLDRHVQRRQRLVGDDEAWLRSQRAGNAQALLLAT